ncbi:prephenate dehydrogenase/arogenate dehydrogenase family protein [Candidatus Bathyarchaeota archaeon]|nr:prephenate dehydrogenase/arogenate dehydrogenase family protein [Candidatus Bathyarchaeota archaeon]
MRIAVIGGAGRMGRWLIQHFKRLGLEVSISDVRRDAAERVARIYGVNLYKTNEEAALNSDVIVVSVPIKEVPAVIDRLKGSLKEGSVLIEISSLKRGIVEKLRELSRMKVRAVSIHPLFGPSVERLKDRKIVLVPVADRILEEEYARRFFKDAEFIVLDAEEHDRSMGIVLSLTYFMNLVFASTLRSEDLSFLRKVGGTTFTLQLIVSESIFTEDLSLVKALIFDNKFGLSYISRFAETSNLLVDWIKSGRSVDMEVLYRKVRSELRRDPGFDKAYRKLYEALHAVSS